MQGELVLSRSPGPPESSFNVIDIDYNADNLPAESTVLYYHTSEDEKRKLFPADPDIERTSIPSIYTCSESDITSRRSQS
jgi:hypothetical protein